MPNLAPSSRLPGVLVFCCPPQMPRKLKRHASPRQMGWRLRAMTLGTRCSPLAQINRDNVPT